MKNLLVTLLITQVAHAQMLDFTTNNVEKNVNQINTVTYNFWHLDSPGTPGPSLGDDNYGQVLAAGDFNSDGYQDLAIGVPSYNYLFVNGGAVLILYGSNNGLSSTNSQILSQQGSSDSAEAEDAFGSSLTTGDFNGDGFGDLVVGTPLEDVDIDGGAVNADAGAINIFYGSASGLTNTSTYLTAIDLCGLQVGCQFGFSLAADDIDGDGLSDLAVSAPYTDLFVGGLQTDAGIVLLYYGQPTVGINDSNRVMITQEDTSDGSESGDLFGWSLAFGYFNDGFGGRSSNGFISYADLIIGAPNEDVTGVVDAGMIHEFHGSSSGLTFDSSWTQGSFGDLVEAGDLFGFSLAAGDFNGDFNSDLIIGVPFEDITSIVDAGAVNILYGSSGGLTASGSQVISQNSPGIFGVSEAGDLFGFAVATGRLNGDSYRDAIIGSPLEDFHFSNDGFVQTIFGSNTGLNTMTSEYIDVPALENDAHLGNSLVTMYFQADTSVLIGAPATTSIDGDSNSGLVVEVAYKDYDVIFKDEFE